MVMQAEIGGGQPQAKEHEEPPDLAGEPSAWCPGQDTCSEPQPAQLVPASVGT